MQKKTVKIIKYIISIFLLLSVFVYLFSNWHDIKSLIHVRLYYVFLLIPVMATSYLLLSANLFVLLKQRQPEIRWARWFRIHLIKRFMNMHLPQTGNVFEALATRDKFGVNLVDFTSSLVAVNWFSACFNCFAVTIFLALFSLVSGKDFGILLVCVFFIFTVLLITPWLMERSFHHLGKVPLPKFIRYCIEMGHEISENMSKDVLTPFVMAQLLSWNFLFFLNSILTIYLGFKALDLQIPFYNIIPFVVLNSVVGLVNILPANIGLIEYAYGAVGAMVNLELGVGILVSILFRVMSYGVFVFLFFILWGVEITNLNHSSK